MAQYYTDFSGDTVGARPAGTTLKRSSVEQDFTVELIDGIKQLRNLPDATTSNPRGLSFDGLESAGETEVFTEFRNVNGSNNTPRVILFGIDSPDNEYGLSLEGGFNRMRLYRRIQGAFTAITTFNITIRSDTYYKTKFLCIPGSPNILRAKLWEGEAEPDWQIDETDDNRALTTGWSGLLSFANNTQEARHKSVGIGTNGDPAPTGPVVAGAPTLSKPTATSVSATSIGFKVPVTF